MKKNILYILAAFALIITACKSPKEKALKDIDQLEAADSSGFSIENTAKLKGAYLAYAEKYPDDERAPEFLFKAAQRCNALAAQSGEQVQHKEAITYFDRIRKDYPKHQMAEDAMFLTGYIYENHLGDTTKAKAVYKEFIAAYPNGELAEEAAMAIRHLSTDPYDVIKKAQAEKADSIQ